MVFASSPQLLHRQSPTSQVPRTRFLRHFPTATMQKHQFVGHSPVVTDDLVVASFAQRRLLPCFQSTVRAELACHGIVPADVLPAYKGDAMKFPNLFFSLSVSASLHPFGWFTAIQASI
jgi:hypothetical protein